MRRKTGCYFYIKTLLFVLIISLSGCHASYYRVKTVKPKKHFGYYNDKKDRKKKRIKTVKYKSLKKTRGIHKTKKNSKDE